MPSFATKVEMKGWRAGIIAGAGLFLVATALALSAVIAGAAKLSIAWALTATFGGIGVGLVCYAIYCRLHRAAWLFEADEQKIVWHCTNASGVTRGRKEVQVTDLSGITRSNGGSDGGSSVYLDLRSGERHRISGIIPSDQDFLSWASVNYRSVKVILE